MAELLIALAILGEIATFTIPKIINSQTNGRNNAIAKETMATMASAYQQLQLNSSGSVPGSTTAGALSQYMNYVAVDAISSIDGYPTGPATMSCASYTCLKLHSGATLMLITPVSFNSAGFIDGLLDPDGQVTSKNDSIIFYIYITGRVTTAGDVVGSSVNPTWFSY